MVFFQRHFNQPSPRKDEVSPKWCGYIVCEQWMFSTKLVSEMPEDVVIFHKMTEDLLMEISRILLGTMTVRIKLHGNASNSCWDISAWTKVVDWPANMWIPCATGMAENNAALSFHLSISVAHQYPPPVLSSTQTFSDFVQPSCVVCLQCTLWPKNNGVTVDVCHGLTPLSH